ESRFDGVVAATQSHRQPVAKESLDGKGNRPGSLHPSTCHHDRSRYFVGSRLTTLYEQADPKRQRGLRHVVSDVTTRVQGGDSFNEAIAKHPRVFNRLFVSMVKAGETGGLLAEILDRLAGFLEASARLRKKVKSAMTYPVIVIIIAFAITTFLIVRVVPVFGEIFKDFGAKLPAPTQFLIDVSDFVRGEWYFLLIGIGSLIFGVRAFL